MPGQTLESERLPGDAGLAFVVRRVRQCWCASKSFENILIRKYIKPYHGMKGARCDCVGMAVTRQGLAPTR